MLGRSIPVDTREQQIDHIMKMDEPEEWQQRTFVDKLRRRFVE
jgi:hypothetical protein